MNKTPVSILQELMVKRKEPFPDYRIEHCGDRPGFSFKCTVKFGHQLEVSGFANSKQDAKQNSAKKALEVLGYSSNIIEQQMLPVPQINSDPKNKIYINYIGQLNEFASVNGKTYPNYHCDGISITGSFVTHCNFLQWTTEGYGLNKKDSKQDAARKMLNRTKTMDISTVTDKIASLRLDQLENLKLLNKEILKRYENLSSSKDNVISKTTEFQPIPNLNKKSVRTLEELQEEMNKCGFKYSLQMFQASPYIMMMKIHDSNAVLMGTGVSKEEALSDLFESAFKMLNHGFSLSTE